MNFRLSRTDYYKTGISVYCDVKKKARDIYINSININKLKAVIVSPGSLTGKPIGNKTTTSVGLIRKILKGFPVLKGGASYVSTSKIAQGLVLAYEQGTIGEEYMMGGENLRMIDFAHIVKTIYNIKN